MVSVVPMPVEPRVVPSPLDDRLIHVAEPPGGPGDHLLHQGLIGRQDPVGRLEHELDEEGDRHPARDLPGGHPAHAVGHDHAIPRLLVVGRHMTVRQVRRERLEEAAEADDQEVVLVVRPDLALMGLAGEIGLDRRGGTPCLHRRLGRRWVVFARVR